MYSTIAPDSARTLQGIENAVRDGYGCVITIENCQPASGAEDPECLRSRAPVNISKLANDIALPENGALFFGSSDADQLSYEFSKLQNGAFTAALIEGLSGRTDRQGNNDGQVDTAELCAWLRNRVPELTEVRQMPIRHQSAPVEYTLAAGR